MGFARTEAEIAERAARFLKAELKRADVTYEELAKRLEENGLNETREFNRVQTEAGDVSGYFLFSVLRCLEPRPPPVGRYLKRYEPLEKSALSARFHAEV